MSIFQNSKDLKKKNFKNESTNKKMKINYFRKSFKSYF